MRTQLTAALITMLTAGLSYAEPQNVHITSAPMPMIPAPTAPVSVGVAAGPQPSSHDFAMSPLGTMPILSLGLGTPSSTGITGGFTPPTNVSLGGPQGDLVGTTSRLHTVQTMRQPDTRALIRPVLGSELTFRYGEARTAATRGETAAPATFVFRAGSATPTLNFRPMFTFLEPHDFHL